MSDKKSDSRIILAELIPSKDVCSYIEQQGRVLNDFEKATLIYNHSGMDYEEKTKLLKNLLESTENAELKGQIQERICYDDQCQKRFYAKEDESISCLCIRRRIMNICHMGIIPAERWQSDPARSFRRNFMCRRSSCLRKRMNRRRIRKRRQDILT